ncbi:MAG: O-acetyl-ADP-ribose deacetylase [candidate division WOR-3 bacterium]|nr:O-acetyl-ADP-ribose deacetylase [candidate division WOR-3 bacterium]
MTEIDFVKGDITKIDTEVIVNAANSSLLGGGGVDGAIHRAAGPGLLKECRAIKGNPRCPTGEARITKGYRLPAQYIIHTVGPVYSKGSQKERELLYNAYYNSLDLARKNNIESIAFPAISTGVYGYPADEAASVSLEAVQNFVNKYPDAFERIVFVLFNNETHSIFRSQGEDSGLL